MGRRRNKVELLVFYIQDMLALTGKERQPFHGVPGPYRVVEDIV